MSNKSSAMKQWQGNAQAAGKKHQSEPPRTHVRTISRKPKSEGKEPQDPTLAWLDWAMSQEVSVDERETWASDEWPSDE